MSVWQKWSSVGDCVFVWGVGESLGREKIFCTRVDVSCVCVCVCIDPQKHIHVSSMGERGTKWRQDRERKRLVKNVMDISFV